MKWANSTFFSRFFTLTSILLFGLVSCSDDSTLFDDVSFDNFPVDQIPGYVSSDTVDIALGNYHEGGIIFYIDPTGRGGLIVSEEDLSIDAPWWNGDFIQTNAWNLADGWDNTFKIVRAQGDESPYSAKLCNDYEVDGFDNWYLPSKQELDLLFKNKDYLENISDGLYWSSTEYEFGSVWVQDFSTGEQHLNNTSDSAGVRTRAIRRF